jgi:hypothetical protein
VTRRSTSARGSSASPLRRRSRGQEVGPEHLLLGLLADAGDPLETEHPHEQRLRGLVGLPTRGAHAIKLLVEARGLTLEALRAALLSELDRDR